MSNPFKNILNWLSKNFSNDTSRVIITASIVGWIISAVAQATAIAFDPKLDKGSIILMHNGTENTALSLDMIIKNIKQKGYELVTISELIYKENYSIDNNGVQHKS